MRLQVQKEPQKAPLRLENTEYLPTLKRREGYRGGGEREQARRRAICDA